MLLSTFLISGTVLGLQQVPAVERSPFGGRVGKTYDITSFGAKSDNATLNTKAFENGTSCIYVSHFFFLLNFFTCVFSFCFTYILFDQRLLLLKRTAQELFIFQMVYLSLVPST